MLSFIRARVGLSSILVFIGAFTVCFAWVWGPLAFIGGTLAAIGGIWSTIDQNKSDTELRKKSEFIVNYITGGDSYCYIRPLPFKDGRGVSFQLMHEGRYPIYNVQIRVVDTIRWNAFVKSKKDELTIHDMHACDIICENIGTLNPTFSLNILNMGYPPNEKKLSYNIFITSRNCNITQNLRFIRLNDKWLCAARAFKTFEERHTLFELIDDGYPRREDGEVEW